MSNRIKHPIVYTEDYCVRAHEVSVGHTLTAPSLLMLLQEASMGSAAELRMSVHDVSMDDKGWVLLRKKINIHKVPALGDKVTVDTYPSHFDRAFAHRDYRMYDSDGELVATGSSVWTLLDLTARKMVRMPQSLIEMDLPSEQLPLPERKIPAVDKADITHRHTVRYHDTDWNKHLNNINLFKYILQCVPDQHVDQYRCVPSEISYIVKAETYIGDTLVVDTQVISDGEMIHQVRRESDDALVAQARTLWG